MANGSLREQHALFGARDICIEKLSSKQFDIMLLKKMQAKPTSEATIQAKFSDITIDWPNTYMYARYATIDN
jgi:hypothetical protein